MQTQHLIITVGLVIGLLLTPYFTRRAILRAISRSYVADHTTGVNLKNKQLTEQVEALTAIATTHERALERAQHRYTLLVKHLTPQLAELRVTADRLAELSHPNPRRSHMKKQAILILHAQELDRTCHALKRCLHPNDTPKAVS